MPRLIDADAFAKDLEIAASSLRVSWVMDRHEMFAKRDAYREIADRVRKAPTIDYAPVRHGEWKFFMLNRGDRQYVDSDLTCSKCSHRFVRLKGMQIFNYCPNCGAKMDGGKHD